MVAVYVYQGWPSEMPDTLRHKALVVIALEHRRDRGATFVRLPVGVPVVDTVLQPQRPSEGRQASIRRRAVRHDQPRYGRLVFEPAQAVLHLLEFARGHFSVALPSGSSYRAGRLGRTAAPGGGEQDASPRRPQPPSGSKQVDSPIPLDIDIEAWNNHTGDVHVGSILCVNGSHGRQPESALTSRLTAMLTSGRNRDWVYRRDPVGPGSRLRGPRPGRRASSRTTSATCPRCRFGGEIPAGFIIAEGRTGRAFQGVESRISTSVQTSDWPTKSSTPAISRWRASAEPTTRHRC